MFVPNFFFFRFIYRKLVSASRITLHINSAKKAILDEGKAIMQESILLKKKADAEKKVVSEADEKKEEENVEPALCSSLPAKLCVNQ